MIEINIKRRELRLTYLLTRIPETRVWRVASPSTNLLHAFPTLADAVAFSRKAAGTRRATIEICDADGLAERAIELNDSNLEVPKL